MHSSLFFTALPLLASAWSEHTLLARSTGNETLCDAGGQVCGTWCIPGNYTCCPDLEGGCSSDSVCQEGDNGEYGCCSVGAICTGNGGSEYLGGESNSSSSSTSTGTADASIASQTTSATGAAQVVVLSQGLTVAALAAGVAALI